MSVLRELFAKHKCDKLQHHYYKEYENEFESIRHQPLNILEVGIWKGTSHSTWVEYFPNAQIYGIDIFTRIQPEDVPILKHPRMHWIKGDSTDSNIVQNIKREWGDIGFDYIIDDGKHTPQSNKDTLSLLCPFLKRTGIYYVEDVWPLDVLTKQQWNHHWLKQKPDDYNMDKWDEFVNCCKYFFNRVEVVDMRAQSKMPDSVLYKLYGG